MTRRLVLLALCALAGLLPQASIAADVEHPASVAVPLAVGHAEMLFLFESGPSLRLERRRWATGSVASFTLPAPPRDAQGRPARHVLAVNGSGIWVVSHRIVLVRPDGPLAQVDFPIPSTTRALTSAEGGELDIAIGLVDGDLLLLRKVRGETRGFAYRVHLQPPAGLVIRRLEDTPAFNHGASATRLADGRVLLLGGYGAADKAWVFDPSRDRWAPTGSLHHMRLNAALAATPDGGAFVAGNGGQVEGDAGGAHEAASHGAEVWDPRSGQWRALPPLPLSARVTTYGADGPSAAVLPDGSLLLAGAMHAQVLLLRARGGGYAPHWQVAATLSKPRMGGIVQALGPDRLVVTHGVQANDEMRCCRLATGSELLPVPAEGAPRAASTGLARREAAVARRGRRVFAAGGWQGYGFSTSVVQASALAELVDEAAGTVAELPPLPQPLFTGQAAWLDDDRVVVKALAHRALYENSFRGMDGRALEFDSPGFLAVLDLKRRTWTTLGDETLARAELAGVQRGEAVLINPDGAAWRVDLATGQLRTLPAASFARRGGTQRVLADGRIVVAGGQAQVDSILAVDADCQGPACVPRLFGTGPLAPARHYEVLHEGRWTASVPSTAGSASAVVRPDGRVVSLGWLEAPAEGKAPGRWVIEESRTPGDAWRALPWPPGLSAATGGPAPSCGDSAQDAACRLLQVEHPALPVPALLLLRSGAQPLEKAWIRRDDAGGWQAVAIERPGPAAAPLADRVPLMAVDGMTLYGSGLATAQARFWLQ